MKSFYCNGKHALCDLDTCPDDCGYFDDSGGELIYEPDVVTNADRIKAMSLDELADFICNIDLCHNCSEHERLSDNPLMRLQKCDADCVRHALEWLKQPVEEEP